MQLMETMDQLLEEAGCTTDQIQQVRCYLKSIPLNMGIFDELYPGVLKSKVYDGHSFEMGTLGEPFRAT